MRIDHYRLPARDGYPLGVSAYRPLQPRYSLLLNSATGVPKRFYQGFAEHAASRVDLLQRQLDAAPVVVVARGHRLVAVDVADLDGVRGKSGRAQGQHGRDQHRKGHRGFRHGSRSCLNA